MLGRPRSASGKLAKGLGISLFPQHLDILRERARELNCPESVLLQLLLEKEGRDGLLRRDIIARFKQTVPEALTPTPEAP